MEPADSLVLRLLDEHHLSCPVCGYDLHRLTVPRCSECGRPVALKVILSDPPLRWAWIGALAAACLNTGLGLAMLVYATGTGSSRSFHEVVLPPGRLFDLVLYAEMVMLVSPLIILLFRRRYMSLPMWTQISLALAAAALGSLAFYGVAIHIH